jgi:hypothetical protein
LQPHRPGRADDNVTIAYDTYDVTDLARAVAAAPTFAQATGPSRLVLGLQGYNSVPNTRFMLELHLMYASGERATIYGTNRNSWQALDASHVFGLRPSTQTTGGYFQQPQEDLDARVYPTGWLLAGFEGTAMPSGTQANPSGTAESNEDSDAVAGERAAYHQSNRQTDQPARNGWLAAVEQSPFPLPLVAKTTQSLELDEQKAVLVVKTAPGKYFFDFGREIQAGIRLVISGVTKGMAGETAVLKLGESLVAGGAAHVLRFPMFTSNQYQSVLTLGGDGGSSISGGGAENGSQSTFEHHEYSEFRYGTLEFADVTVGDNVTLDIRAWVVRCVTAAVLAHERTHVQAYTRTSFTRIQSVCVCACVRGCVCVYMCVCVCARARVGGAHGQPVQSWSTAYLSSRF